MLPSSLRLSEVLAGLSHALDLTEGQRPGHAVRTCLIGMRLAEVLRLPQEMRSPLFYALLMKDLGCSSNAARFAVLFGANDHDIKADLKATNWSQALESFRFVARNVAPGHFWLRRVWQLLGVLSRGPEGAREVVVTRCERGADIAHMLGFPDDTAQAIRALDEHWDGAGQPYNLKGDSIPLLARILGLATLQEEPRLLIAFLMQVMEQQRIRCWRQRAHEFVELCEQRPQVRLRHGVRHGCQCLDLGHFNCPQKTDDNNEADDDDDEFLEHGKTEAMETVVK